MSDHTNTWPCRHDFHGKCMWNHDHGINGPPVHKDPCTCTIDSRSGAIINYDCGNGPDMVNHPPRYISHASDIECIQIGRYLTADWFNAFKYVFRFTLKNGKQDLEKALWYAKDAITHDIPVRGEGWTTYHAMLLDTIMDFELNALKRSFFRAIQAGDGRMAKDYIEYLIEDFDE